MRKACNDLLFQPLIEYVCKKKSFCAERVSSAPSVPVFLICSSSRLLMTVDLLYVQLRFRWQKKAESKPAAPSRSPGTSPRSNSGASSGLRGWHASSIAGFLRSTSSVMLCPAIVLTQPSGVCEQIVHTSNLQTAATRQKLQHLDRIESRNRFFGNPSVVSKRNVNKDGERKVRGCR